MGIATIAATWPHAKRIAIGGWPPVSPEKFDFHIAGADTPPLVARAAALSVRLAAPGTSGVAGAPAVLVIDDMRTMRDLATSMLELDGFAVNAVATVQEALAHLDRFGYAAVLTEVFIAGTSGIEDIRELRRRASEMAIVAISGGLDERMGEGSALAAAIRIGAHRASPGRSSAGIWRTPCGAPWRMFRLDRPRRRPDQAHIRSRRASP